MGGWGWRQLSADEHPQALNYHLESPVILSRLPPPKLEDNGSTGLHRGYKLLQIEQANMLHPCSTALIKIIKRSDRRGRKPKS